MDSSSTPIKFEIYAGEQVIRTEILTGPTIKIGKVTSSTLRLDEDSVSRMHAQIEITNPDNVVLLDLGSERGTTVNGQRVTRTRLNTNDQIQFGDVRVRVTIVGQRVAQPTASAARPAPVAQPISLDDADLGYGRVLEVLGLYGNNVLDVSHLRDAGEYQVGFSDNVRCYISEGLVPVDPYPLAVMAPGEVMMVNIPNNVQGEVMLEGKIYNLQELRAEGKLQQSTVPSSSALRLPFKARCRLRFGDFTFLVNAVPDVKPPERLGLKDIFDPQFITSVFSVSAFVATVLMLISMIPQSPEDLALDQLAALEKYVTITLEAEERIEKKEEKKESGSAGSKRAAGTEGAMGKREVADVNKKFQVKGTDTGDPTVISGRKQELAQNTVNEIFASIDSGLLDGTQSAIALGALEGFVGNQNGAVVGNAFGMGGLGGVGTGAGGGGDSLTSFGLGGLSTVGGGGGGGGSGNGYGKGAGDVGGRAVRTPKVIPMDATIEDGNLPKDVIKRVIMTRKGAYQNCYEKQLQLKKDLNGKISILIMVSGSQGNVMLAKLADSSMNNPAVENCIITNIKMLRFPTPKNGKNSRFTYPFRFNPS